MVFLVIIAIGCVAGTERSGQRTAACQRSPSPSTHRLRCWNVFPLAATKAVAGSVLVPRGLAQHQKHLILTLVASTQIRTFSFFLFQEEWLRMIYANSTQQLENWSDVRISSKGGIFTPFWVVFMCVSDEPAAQEALWIHHHHHFISL